MELRITEQEIRDIIREELALKRVPRDLYEAAGRGGALHSWANSQNSKSARKFAEGFEEILADPNREAWFTRDGKKYEIIVPPELVAEIVASPLYILREDAGGWGDTSVTEIEYDHAKDINFERYFFDGSTADSSFYLIDVTQIHDMARALKDATDLNINARWGLGGWVSFEDLRDFWVSLKLMLDPQGQSTMTLVPTPVEQPAYPTGHALVRAWDVLVNEFYQIGIGDRTENLWWLNVGRDWGRASGNPFGKRKKDRSAPTTRPSDTGPGSGPKLSGKQWATRIVSIMEKLDNSSPPDGLRSGLPTLPKQSVDGDDVFFTFWDEQRVQIKLWEHELFTIGHAKQTGIESAQEEAEAETAAEEAEKARVEAARRRGERDPEPEEVKSAEGDPDDLQL